MGTGNVSGRRKAAPKRQRKPSATPANANRGEHTLVLAGVTYRLRPTYTAIVAIEDQLGRSAIELLRAANAMAIGFEDLGMIAAELIRAGADDQDEMTKNVSFERIGELIFEEGYVGPVLAITVVLAHAVSGGRERTGEAGPVTATH